MSVLQDWVTELSFMKQSVLLTSIRGVDGVEKYHPSKKLVRWFRRCILISAFDKCVLTNPYDKRGGSFTGPSYDVSYVVTDWPEAMDDLVGEYFKTIDALPYHFQLHFMHAAEILGYDHPDNKIREWWHKTYCRIVDEMHLYPESKYDLDRRLGDNREQWLNKTEKSISV